MPFPVGELARIGLAAAFMAAVVISFPSEHTTIGLFQSATLGAATYGAAALAFNIMGVREIAVAAARAFLRRNQAISSPANAD